MSLPGWSSLSSITRIHDWLEISGFVLLGLLALLEALQFVYGHRKDTLQTETENRRIESLSNWHMTDKERAILTVALTPFAGQQAQVMTIADTRSREFANDLLDLLISLHWQMGTEPRIRDLMFNREVPFGIEIMVNPAPYGDSQRRAIDALGKAFSTLTC